VPDEPDGFQDCILGLGRAQQGEGHRPPRDYVALREQLETLSTACKTYLRDNLRSDRKAGIDKLTREIALEDVVLAPLADYYAAKTDLMKAWEHLEQAQDKVLDVQSKPEFTCPDCAVEIQRLISQLEAKIRAAGDAADIAKKIVSRDIDQLRKLADLEGMPRILKSIIHEATNAANTRQIDLQINRPGSGYNNSGGLTGPKYSMKHTLGHLGLKWRLGSLLHELTHISIAEIFDNTVLMLAIRKDAIDDEIIHLAGLRNAKIRGLQYKIEAANDLDPALQREMRAQVKYPIDGVLQKYVSTFKPLLSDSDYKQLQQAGQCPQAGRRADRIRHRDQPDGTLVRALEDRRDACRLPRVAHAGTGGLSISRHRPPCPAESARPLRFRDLDAALATRSR
jgi:hypothetical protein